MHRISTVGLKLIGRISLTCFQYTRIGSDGKPLKGRVRAIADGALVLKTNKAKDPTGPCLVWSKQRSVVAFEVVFLMSYMLTIGQECLCELG